MGRSLHAERADQTNPLGHRRNQPGIGAPAAGDEHGRIVERIGLQQVGGHGVRAVGKACPPHDGRVQGAHP